MAIQLGDNGPTVETLQQQLLPMGFPLATDGFFGPFTDDAVRGFQSVVGLVSDGIVGPLTEGALSSNQWENVANISLVHLPLLRRVTTDSVTTNLVSTTLAADVKWPHVIEGHFYDTPMINSVLDTRAHTLIDDLATEPMSGAGAHTIEGELEATLIAPSMVGTAGIFSQLVAGAAEAQPIIITANLDLASDSILGANELFMPGSGWLAVLRNIVLLTFPPASGIDPVPDNYQHLSVTPDGIRIHLLPGQLDLPLASGVQIVNAPWVKIESVVRPSIPARANGHSAGGPGPHVS
ncbi:peptidoglycan-binding domain-containing protein [Verrucomicrobiaceae bacterium 227]